MDERAADDSNGASPSQAFAADFATIRLDDYSLDELLARVARVATASIRGADHASITVIEDGKARTAAFTDDLAMQLDERQYDEGYGPCLDAAVNGQVIQIVDAANDATYPDFARSAHGAGVRRTLSVAMPIRQRTVGALNMYGTGEMPFDDAAVTAAREFVGYAGVAIANAVLYADTVALAEQMRQAMETRAVIEQAKGILIRDNRCSADEAFALLRRASNSSNRKLNDLARSIVESTQRGA